MVGADSLKEQVGVGSLPHPANELELRDLGWHLSLTLSLTSFLCGMNLVPNTFCFLSTYYVPVIMLGSRTERLMFGLWS